MSYVNKVNAVVDSMNLGDPVFSVRVSDRKVDLTPSDWDKGLDTSVFVESLVSRHSHRMFDQRNNKYYLDKDDIASSIASEILNNTMDIFLKTSPNAKPRRTKIFKDFSNTVRENRSNEKFITDLFSIQEYYFNVTRTETISNKNNDVHRTNIYNLLCLMEKSYGKKASN